MKNKNFSEVYLVKKTNVIGMSKKIFSNDRSGMVIAAIAMCIMFASINSNYLSTANIINILVAGSLMGLVAIGESSLLIAGHVDLSPGSISGFSGVLVGVLLASNFPIWGAILIVLICGVIIGFINSQLILRIKLEPFIATLATMSIVRGFAYIINDGKAAPIFSEAFIAIGSSRIFGLPIPVWILFIVVIIFYVLLKYTCFGRNIYYIGGNKEAARFAGINYDKIIIKLYMINAGLASLAGMLLASRMNTGHPSASVGLEFDAVTAAILGGIAFKGGVGTIVGTVLGIFVLQGFNNGLQVLNVQSFWQNVAKGSLLIIALSFDYLRNKNKSK